MSGPEPTTPRGRIGPASAAAAAAARQANVSRPGDNTEANVKKWRRQVEALLKEATQGAVELVDVDNNQSSHTDFVLSPNSTEERYETAVAKLYRQRLGTAWSLEPAELPLPVPGSRFSMLVNTRTVVLRRMALAPLERSKWSFMALAVRDTIGILIAVVFLYLLIFHAS